MLRNFLKALLDRSNISSNITKMPCWIKCWIGFNKTQKKQKKKKSCSMKKNRVGSKFDCKQIFHPTFSGSSNKNFNIGLVYSLFHPTFHSHDVILNVRTSNFECFNKTKTLCKIIAIKKIIHVKSK